MISNKPSIVLVHGLWADGSCWNEVISRLHAADYNVIAVQNPSTSLQDDIDVVKVALNRVNGPVILVGHSWGGFVITAAGVDERVKGLVYIAALAPDTGDSLGSMGANFTPPPLSSHIAVTDGFIAINKEGIPYFAGDLSQAEQDLIYATQGVAAVAVFDTPLEGEPAWKTKPSWYVVGKNDGAINPEQERFMAKRMGAFVIELDSSHVPMISQPDAVVELILKAVEGTQ